NLSSGSTPLAMEFVPDAIGRLEELKWDQTPSTGAPVLLAEYTYLGGVKRFRRTHIDGSTKDIESLFAYDGYGRLSQIKDDSVDPSTSTVTPLAQFDYEYGSAGNLKKEKYTKDDGSAGDRFVYDDFHRLAVGWLGGDTSTMGETD